MVRKLGEKIMNDIREKHTFVICAYKEVVIWKSVLFHLRSKL